MVRPILVHDDWSTIKLGIQFSVNADWGFTPHFALGLCNNANGYGASDTNHFVGIRTSRQEMSYNAGPPDYASLMAFRALKKVGRTITENTSDLTTSATWSLDPNTRSILYMTIEKGSPNFTLGFVVNNTSSVQTDKDEDLFKRGMEVTVGNESTEVGGGLSGGSGRTVAVDESADGTLTNLCFSWFHDRSGEVEVSAIGYKVEA